MNNCTPRTHNCPGIKKCSIISLIDPAITPVLFLVTITIENFWLELAETLVPLQQQFSSVYFTDEMRAILASMYSVIFGNHKAFFPVWVSSGFFNLLQPFRPPPYPLFDITPLKTLSRYVDFTNLGKSNRPRLIVTSTNIQTSEQSYQIANISVLM